MPHLANETSEVWFSVASVWEMGIKVAVGKLPLPESIDSYSSSRVVQLGARSPEISVTHALGAAALPLHHRDPFDRMLIAQVQAENLTLVRADAMFRQYNDFSILWAANS